MNEAAGKIARATLDQFQLVQAHVSRVEERRGRYKPESIAWAAANLELAGWQQVHDILSANIKGVTVQPS